MQDKQKRIGLIIGLTLVLGTVIAFLLHTSQDVRWGGGFWETWIKTYWHLTPEAAHRLVFQVRKTIHFLGYGSLALLFWWYFYLWGLRRTGAGAAFIATGLVAAYDEYNQALSGFRSGQPLDVLLDCCGGLFFILTVYFYRRKRDKREWRD